MSQRGREEGSELERALEVLSRLFAQAFPGRVLGIIIGPAEMLERAQAASTVQAISIRLGLTGPVEETVLVREVIPPPRTITATDLSGEGPQKLPRVEVSPARGLEAIEPVELTPKEAEVLCALEVEGGRLMGKEIAPLIGYKQHDSRPRSLLSGMRKKRLIDSQHGEGYSLTLRGKLSLDRWRANQLFAGEEDEGQ